jgi:enamine deaminase RidA (YjgF/YER057c/UK114 family)
MPIERSNVPGLAQPPGYTHLATVSEARLVFIAGQVPLNERGELVGHGDAIAQVRQCLRNLAACLTAAGATPGDVVRTTVYVAAEERAVLEGV